MDIYFDESGFTGYNLLDPQQPYFVIASSIIGPAEGEEILRTAFPNYRAGCFGDMLQPIPWQTDHLFCWQRDAAHASAA